MNENHCQSCGAPDPQSFYRSRGVPVHSTILLDTEEQAKAYPTGDIDLALCTRCGFAGNLAFDPGRNDYSTQCEESQSFSPQFSRFLRRLTVDLIERYDIRGRTVTEIGCGKGDFLELICELGDNRGVGIDPTYVPNRSEHSSSRSAGRTRYVQRLFDEDYCEIHGDVVCCRHTLEHIYSPGAFIRLLRRSLADRPDAIVFFEVPDFQRVIDEGAFWDIYYEHCSYFTLDSLSRLFESCGFEVLEARADFDDQYLILLAKPRRSWVETDQTQQPAEETPPAVAALAADVRSFRQRTAQALSHWARFIDTRARDGKRIALWGSSSKGVSFLTTLAVKKEIDLVVDINPYRQGKFMPGSGQAIVSPQALVSARPHSIIVMNPIYVDEISAQLAQLGLEAELVAV